MAVYIDELWQWGRWRYGASCHLTADSEDELHVFALRLGMRRSWFQPRPVPHYDLTASRREAALAAGAQFIPAMTQARLRRRARLAAGPR